MTRPRFVPGSTVVFKVKNRSGKKPLAAYLATRLGVVTTWAEDLVKGGHVKLDGTPSQPDDFINLSAGPHDIEVFFPNNWPKHMAATEMPLDILYEDEHLLVINKPPGIVVHPARGHLDNQTLQNGVRHRYRHLLGREETTLGSPHRLDKDTSGAIVFALTRSVYIHLVDQFAASAPHKQYLAIFDGKPNWTEYVCDRPLGSDPERKGLGTVVSETEGGKTARTDFTVIETGRDWALVRAVPHTGRPHQIRIHAASLGFPLAGDRDYNSLPERLPLPRQALHAAGLAFTHPATGLPLRVEAPLPADMHEALCQLRQR